MAPCGFLELTKGFKNELLLIELHFLSPNENLTVYGATYNGSVWKLLCVELSLILVVFFQPGWRLHMRHVLLKSLRSLIDLFLCELSFSFQVKFLRLSDRHSNCQINYRHQSEWEEPKQNSVLAPLIKCLRFYTIKGKLSLWFAAVIAFKRAEGAYVGI